MAKVNRHVYRCLAYQEADNSFTGVCLDLDLVEEDHETFTRAISSVPHELDQRIR